MNEWIDDLSDLAAHGERAVLVTVAGVRGSAPREPGAKMIVTREETLGTIGGGQLEYQCTRIAAGMLEDRQTPSLQSFPLGAAMGQCCGGVVDILFEPLSEDAAHWLQDLRALFGQREPAVVVTGIDDTEKFVVTAASVYGNADKDVIEAARQRLADGSGAARSGHWFYEPVVSCDFNIAVFGAGHVGSAVVAALSHLDCNIRWVDSRRNIFRHVPQNVRAIEAAEPALEVAAMPADSLYLVMTHSHALDFDVCDRILRRNDARYCGLIGSRSKRRRFEKRFRQQGMPDVLLRALTCPIGVDGISGKKPVEIAVAVAAEILQARERATHGTSADDLPDNVHPL